MKIVSYVPHDKAIHLIAGVLLYALFHFVSDLLGLVVVLAAALGKEVYDYFNKDRHTPEWMDAVATVLGGVLGFVCSL